MKKRTLIRIGGLALVLSLISTGLLSTTLAKYTTTVTGNGTATVAAWSFKANGQTATMTPVNLYSTAYEHVTTGKIAPGMKGSFDITIDGSGSDTAIDYAIKFENMQNMPQNLKFYQDAALSNSYELNTGFNGTIALTGINTPISKTVYWEWPYETGVDDSEKATNDAKDTEDAGNSVTFNITVTGTQVQPEVQP